jgi:acyl carrier protein
MPLVPVDHGIDRSGHLPEAVVVSLTPEEIEEKVFEIVSDKLSVDKSELSRSTSFINDLNADSLDTVELVMELEDEFDMTIPDEEAEKLKTIGEAIDHVSNQLASAKK